MKQLIFIRLFTLDHNGLNRTAPFDYIQVKNLRSINKVSQKLFDFRQTRNRLRVMSVMFSRNGGNVFSIL